MKARQKAPRFPEELLHLEATPRLELGMRVLQTRALPLGYVARVTPTRFELVLPP